MRIVYGILEKVDDPEYGRVDFLVNPSKEEFLGYFRRCVMKAQEHYGDMFYGQAPHLRAILMWESGELFVTSPFVVIHDQFAKVCGIGDDDVYVPIYLRKDGVDIAYYFNRPPVNAANKVKVKAFVQGCQSIREIYGGAKIPVLDA